MVSVQISHLTKRFGDNLVLDDVSFQVAEGEVVCLLGPSGSGKSTLLRCINRLEVATGGDIFVGGQRIGYEEAGDGTLRLVDGKTLAKQRVGTGMVFQRFNLFPHMTALENVASGPIKVLGVRKKQAHEQAQALLERVGLGERASFYPAQLSGGQQQRVAIARALAMSPKVMLFDEPTSALDPELVGEVLAVIKELASTGMTMIIVTHQLEFARDVADRVVFMDKGKILEDGDTDSVLNRPTHERASAFFAQLQRK